MLLAPEVEQALKREDQTPWKTDRHAFELESVGKDGAMRLGPQRRLIPWQGEVLRGGLLSGGDLRDSDGASFYDGVIDMLDACINEEGTPERVAPVDRIGLSDKVADMSDEDVHEVLKAVVEREFGPQARAEMRQVDVNTHASTQVVNLQPRVVIDIDGHDEARDFVAGTTTMIHLFDGIKIDLTLHSGTQTASEG